MKTIEYEYEDPEMGTSHKVIISEGVEPYRLDVQEISMGEDGCQFDNRVSIPPHMVGRMLDMLLERILQAIGEKDPHIQD